MAQSIVNSWFFRKLIHIAKNKGYFTKADIEQVIISTRRNDGKQRYTTTTVPRRVKTIVSWTKWLAENFSCFEVTDNEYKLT